MAARGRLVVGVEAAYEVDGVPRQNGAVVEPGIGMRLVAPFRVGCSEQAVEGERASRSRDKHPPWASSGQSSPPSLRPMSILDHLTHDRLESQQENRCRWRGDRNEPRNHDQSTVHRRRAKSPAAAAGAASRVLPHGVQVAVAAGEVLAGLGLLEPRPERGRAQQRPLLVVVLHDEHPAGAQQRDRTHKDVDRNL